MSPLFSIITVTYNAENTLRRTIESVTNQTCSLYEHIIMDGESTDNTIDIAETYGNDHTIIVSQHDEGIYDAMNHAMAMCKGDYVIFLNSGDKFHSPDTLQTIANAILNNDYPGIVYGQTDIVDNDGTYLGPRHLKAPENLTIDNFKDGMVVCHQAFVVLRQLASFYNLKYKYSADYEWCIICLQHSRCNIYIPEVIIDYLSEGETTRHHKESLIERYKIMCEYYGTLPTIVRHIKFLFRYLLRRNKGSADTTGW